MHHFSLYPKYIEITGAGKTIAKYPLHVGKCPTCQHPQEIGFDGKCSTCRRWIHLERIVAMGPYMTHGTSDLDQHIILAKGNPYYSDLLGCALALFVIHRAPDLLNYDILVPVPGHDNSDHLNALFRRFQKITNRFVLRTDLVHREGHTKFSGVNLATRIAAAKEFIPGDGRFLSGSSVLIIDDVLTTGTSMEACANILDDKGAGRIVGLVIGRTVNREWGNQSKIHRLGIF